MEELKLGELLLDKDKITKKQLGEALLEQQKGDKRKLGEILISLGHIDAEDLAEVLLDSDGDSQNLEEIVEEKLSIAERQKKKKKEAKKAAQAEPIEISEEKVMDTKVTMSLQTMIGFGTVIATAIGGYYYMLGEIEEAKNLPDISSIYENTYSANRDQKKNNQWPVSYDQFIGQIRQLQDDMDDMYKQVEELKEEVKYLRREK